MSFYNWKHACLDLEYFYLLFVPLFLFLVLRSRFIFSRKRKTAKILRISPFFQEEGQSRTKLLLCEYLYIHGEESSNSQCLLPLKAFFRKQKGCGKLSWDKGLSAPVLKYKQAHIVGKEAIGHYLLQFKKSIRISYEKARPEFCYPDELWARRVPEKLKETRIRNKRSVSLGLSIFFVSLCFFVSIIGEVFAQMDEKKKFQFFQNAPEIKKTEEEEPKEYQQALALYLKGNFEASLKKIRSVFEKHKNRMSFRILAGANYIALGKASRALPHIRIARRLYPRRFEPALLYASLLRSQRKYYEAISHIRQTIQKIGDSPALSLEASAIYYELKNYPKARIQIQRVLELDPQNYYAFYIDGLLFLQERRYELAEFRLRNALALKPKHKRDIKLLYNNLGLALEKKGEALEKRAKIAQAKQSYREAKIFYSYALELDLKNQIIRRNKERMDRR